MARALINAPARAQRGSIIEIKTLISHVMESGQRRESDGTPVPRFIINSFSASFAGNEVFKAELSPAISSNPYLVFFMRVPGPGEFELAWTDDNGAKVSEKLRLNVV
jgi:sulfur-oxidizing protein SoxZ